MSSAHTEQSAYESRLFCFGDPNLTPDAANSITDLIDVELDSVGTADLAELADVSPSDPHGGAAQPGV
ncbi:MAG: hypothetical protein ACYCTH_10670 [Cellulomonas sp.]